MTATPLFRGATVLFRTFFFDENGASASPPGATLLIDYPLPDGTMGTASIAMATPVSPDAPWTGQWDSRGAAPGSVYWSIHTTTSLPYAVEDGRFNLQANLANAETFT